MDLDENKPKPKAVIQVGDVLDLMSVEELELRVAALESEMLRVKSEIARKQSSRSAAESFFKTKG